MIAVELEGLEVFGHHGVTEEERERGQTFLYDVWMAVPESALSDRIEDTIDYVEVVELVQEISNGRRFNLLEALAAAVANGVAERFGVERVRVRVRKREVEPAGLSVAWTAATVERP